MGVLEKRHIDSLTEKKRTGVGSWSMAPLTGVFLKRVNAGAQRSRQCGTGILPGLPQGSRPLLVSHGIALGCLVVRFSDYQHGQSAAYVCVTVLFARGLSGKPVAGVWLGC